MAEAKSNLNIISSIRSQSPESSYVSSSSEDDFSTENIDQLRKQNFRISPVDPTVISELEEQAKVSSKSLAIIMKYLSKELKHVSAVTMETVSTYDLTIEHAQNEVEQNIRSMYGLIAKCEELDRKMKPVTELANQVRHIREMVDLLEQLCK